MFQYLIDKINNANFEVEPFKHIIINEFFTEEHFNKIISDAQIKRPIAKNNKDLVDDLLKNGYVPQEFPGCITSIPKYLEFLDNPDSKFNKNLIDGYGKHIIEGYGLTMRMEDCRSPFLTELITFLNGEAFQACLLAKFQIKEKHYIETAYQKNLNGYEISPHADTRKKALTYMVNIYTESNAEELSIHTHLMKFRQEYKYLYDFWKYNTVVDTCWVPWDWCTTEKTTNTNNSISIFKPSYDTLHAVKLDYNHLVQQRNQIYGNLWYEKSPHKYGSGFQDVDLLKLHQVKENRNNGVGGMIARKISKILGA